MYAKLSVNLGKQKRQKNKIKDKNSKTNNRDLKVKFWDLDLPTETKKYVPRLLALAHFIERADEYNFSLPEIPNR